MKKLLFVLFLGFIGLTNQSFAQYQSIFGNDTTEWNGNYGIPDAEMSFSVKAYGDTIINDLHYKYVGSNVYASQINPPIGAGQPTGFIREDTTTGRVWHLYNGEEILLMDMSLSVSDTFTYHTLISGGGYIPEYNVKLVVDSVYTYNNRKYIGFKHDFHYFIIDFKLLFIEGIGANNMFCHLADLYYYDWIFLTCVHKDGELVYGDNNSCLVYGLGLIDIEKWNIIKIYPTIVNDILTIETQDNDIKELEVIDVLGRVVKRESIYNNKQMNCSQLNAGVYNCVITTQDNKRVAKKFIKQ